MARDVNYGILYAVLSAVIFAGMLLLFSLGRAFEFKTYPHYLLPAATILPMFLSSIFVNGLIRVKAEKLSRKEHVAFALIALFGTGLAAVLTESYFLYTALQDIQEVSFTEILFAPLSERYKVGVLFGLSFTASAVIVAAYTCLIRIPFTITARLHRAATATTNT